MKKFIFAIICFFAFCLMLYNISSENYGVVINDEGDFKESFNSAENMALAREIGEKTKAKETVVIGNEKRILAGISLEKGTENRSALKTLSEQILREKYPEAQIKVEVQTAKTEGILSFARSIEKGEKGKNLKEKAEKLFNP